MPDVIALSLIADLGFSVRIEDAANRLGFRVATVSTPEKAIGTLKQGRASLFIMDLTAAGARAAEIVTAARNAPYPVAVLVFGPGTDLQAQQVAQETGADLVVDTSEFSSEISRWLIACLDRHRETRTPERGIE